MTAITIETSRMFSTMPISNSRSFDLQVAYWSFGWLPSDQLPEVALQALEIGFDTPSLIELVGRPSEPNPELHLLFERALLELDRERMDIAEAGRLIARDYALQICAKTISPIQGAKAIWRVSLECDEPISELGIFAGRASEYEDLPHLREEISEDIVQEAYALLESR